MHYKSELWLCAFGILGAVFLRCCTSLHPHSGQNKPPMFGDYEAQRHWMEITLNLPLKEWYHNTTSNDLQYWGLDYPPLTAYHSYLCGVVAAFIDPNFVALADSRGHESENHKLFMRYSVLIVDLLLYTPAIIAYFVVTSKACKKAVQIGKQKVSQISTSLAIILALFYPGLILIDHGHFQYNCVSLGFAVLAITFVSINQTVLGSLFFCLALNYKQMELYHSLPFFVYLLSTCIPKPGQNYLDGLKTFTKISVTVLVTFAIVWLPFLFDLNDTLQVVHRLFPVARGVFEDKVGNVWCTLNAVYKFKKTFTNPQMVRYCTISTLVAVLPSCADLFLRPNVKKFVPSLVNSSLAFFLFSFQVHEKSILLAAIPVLLLIRVEPLASFWFLTVSVFSMFPLFVKDDLVLAFVALVTFYTAIFQACLALDTKNSNSNFVFRCLDNVRKILDNQMTTDENFFDYVNRNGQVFYEFFKYAALCASLSGYAVLIVLTLTFDPPPNYPDIFPLLISVYSCLHFLTFFVYFNVVQFRIPQAAEDVRFIKLKNL